MYHHAHRPQSIERVRERRPQSDAHMASKGVVFPNISLAPVRVLSVVHYSHSSCPDCCSSTFGLGCCQGVVPSPSFTRDTRNDDCRRHPLLLVVG